MDCRYPVYLLALSDAIAAFDSVDHVHLLCHLSETVGIKDLHGSLLNLVRLGVPHLLAFSVELFLPTSWTSSPYSFH